MIVFSLGTSLHKFKPLEVLNLLAISCNAQSTEMLCKICIYFMSIICMCQIMLFDVMLFLFHLRHS